MHRYVHHNRNYGSIDLDQMELTHTSLSSLCVVNLNNSKILSPPDFTTRNLKKNRSRLPCLMASSPHKTLHLKQRRSANYHPSIWDTKLIESLSTPYEHELYATRMEELNQEAIELLESTKDPGVLLKLIDSMQRLGVHYHFEQEIKEALNHVKLDVTNEDLYTTSLLFRLLRAHGYPADVFDKFRGGDGKLMDGLSKEVPGLLSLYEASFLGMDGEDVLEEVNNFCAQQLKSILSNLNSDMAEQVQQSLEIPLHWRMPRIEARNFINVYDKDSTRSSILLELAKLDYNLVQAVYQRELKELARWWRDLGFKEKLEFSRDRLMENYLWAMGMIFEPQFSKCRIALTKFVCILTAIDDIYDVYGTLDELELYTDAVTRWDLQAMEVLPGYMKTCYLAMFNFVNELTYDILKDHDFNALPYFKQEWKNLCKSYLVEARWFHNGYAPTLKEYMENAWISVGGHAAIVHAYILMESSLSNKSLDSFKHASPLIYHSSIITRLSDDLGTSAAERKRGDVTKSIQCYMNEQSVSEEEAEDQIRSLITQSWKMVNKESTKTYLPRSLVKLCLNMARTAQCIFQHGDGIGTSIGITNDLLTSLIVNPIPIN